MVSCTETDARHSAPTHSPRVVERAVDLLVRVSQAKPRPVWVGSKVTVDVRIKDKYVKRDRRVTSWETSSARALTLRSSRW